MEFLFLSHRSRPPRNPSPTRVAYLIEDNWNDYGYVTQYQLVIHDGRGKLDEIGYVKFGQREMAEDQTSPELPERFRQLSDEFFSLGQDELYYLRLISAYPADAREILAALRDVAADEALFEEVLHEPVMGISLLRSVERITVTRQFRRILRGGPTLSDFKFNFVLGPGKAVTNEIRLDFDVKANSTPPTNIHVIIGGNGAGKTTVLNGMVEAFLGEARTKGKFQNQEDSNANDNFAGIVSVTFSAFDPFLPWKTNINKSDGVTHTYIGLKREQEHDAVTGPDEPRVMNTEELSSAFAGSVGRIVAQRGRRSRWKAALTTLSSDPIFMEENLNDLSDIDRRDVLEIAHSRFKRLSSGHKIALLTMARLIEAVEERTLVLLDEPEAHLHPPLLSALMTAISDLMIDRNGVAVVATHSPVVLQEVPRSCVSILGRTGSYARVQRPEIETFGENVGVLTREVFGLEVTSSGFHARLEEALALNSNDFAAALASLGGSLGVEGKAILRAMSVTRTRRGDRR